MKKTVLLLSALTILLLSTCAKPVKVSLDPLPSGYTLEDAKADGCVVFEDIDITEGQAVWDAFVKAAKKGETAAVRLAYYYTLGDPSRYAPELYEEMKSEYPKLFLVDLSCDGGVYTVTDYSDAQPASKEYRYLVKYEGEPKSKSATYSHYTYWVLVNDNTVTWEEIESGMASSQFGAGIDHRTVYFDLVFK